MATTTQQHKGAEHAPAQILDILSDYKPAEQNEIIKSVVTKIRLERLKHLHDNESKIQAMKENINSLNQSVNESLNAQLPPPDQQQ